MPADTLMQLQASVTKATTFQGAGLNITSGVFPGELLVARFLYSAATSTTTNAAAFTIEASYDAGSTWGTVGGTGAGTGDPLGAPLALTTTAQAGESFVPFNVRGTGALPVQIRAVITISGAGTASVTYQVDIVPSFP